MQIPRRSFLALIAAMFIFAFSGCEGETSKADSADELTLEIRNAAPLAPEALTEGPALVLLRDLKALSIEETLRALKAANVRVLEVAGERAIIVENTPALSSIRGLEKARILTELNLQDPELQTIEGLHGIEAIWLHYKGKFVWREYSIKREPLPLPLDATWRPTLRGIAAPESLPELSEPTGKSWGEGGGLEKALDPPYDAEDERLLQKYSPAPGTNQTSEYMIGNVIVYMIFVDGPTHKWQSSMIDNAIAKIQSGLNWFITQKTEAQISFEYVIPNTPSRTIEVSVNPTTLASSSENTWVYEILAAHGFSQSFSGRRQMNNWLRDTVSTNNADWAFHIYMVTDGVNNNGTTFTDGYFAYAYVRGPSVTMTDDINGWGPTRIDQVAAHETGHIFGAGDEYCSPGYACCSCSSVYGYLNVPNSNCEAGCPVGSCGGGEPGCAGCASCINVSCLMNNNVWNICPVSQAQIGWRDTDGDGILDPVDSVPTATLNAFTPNPTDNPTPTYTGSAAENTSNLISYIADVKFRVLKNEDDSVVYDWESATPADGSFNGYAENFTFTTSSLTTGTYKIQAQSITRWGAKSSIAQHVLTVSCNDGNPCTDDAMVDGKCEHTNNTADCTDGNPCTLNDKCAGGSCSGTPKNCDDGNVCTDNSCNSATGECEAVNNTKTCDPGGGLCATGTCKEGACESIPLNCDDGNPCTNDFCNESDGKCEYTNNTADCSDENPCTLNDKCAGGICSGTPKNCDDGNPCTLNDRCVGGACVSDPKNCDDGNVCTDNSCDPANGNCLAVNNTAACNDGHHCTINDLCSGGSCSGTPKNCDDGNICTDNSCNLANGNCVATNNANSCDTGNYCQIGACSGGSCLGTPRNCSDGIACTTDSCNSAQSRCEHTLNSGFCLINDECVSEGSSPQNNPCKVCDPAQNAYDWSNKANGTSCPGDGLSCTVDACQSGVCSHTLQNACLIGGVCRGADAINPENPCQKCNPASPNSWSFVTDGTECDDGTYCTEGDRCVSGVCNSGQPRDCSAQNDECNEGVCDETQAACVKRPKAEGLPCGSPRSCANGTLKPTDACNALGACVKAKNQSCAPYLNCKSETECADSCSTNAECIGGHQCIRSVCRTNVAPVANAGSQQTVDEDEETTLDGRGSSDADGDPLTFEWRQISGPSVALNDATANTPRFRSPIVFEETAMHFQLVVSDGYAQSSPAQTIVIVRNNINEPPIADAGKNFKVEALQKVTLNGSKSSDPNGDEIAFLWSQEEGVKVTLSSPTTAMPSFTAPDVKEDSELAFKLVVNDGMANSSPASVTVTVLAPPPPADDDDDNNDDNNDDDNQGGEKDAGENDAGEDIPDAGNNPPKEDASDAEGGSGEGEDDDNEGDEEDDEEGKEGDEEEFVIPTPAGNSDIEQEVEDKNPLDCLNCRVSGRNEAANIYLLLLMLLGLAFRRPR